MVRACCLVLGVVFAAGCTGGSTLSGNSSLSTNNSSANSHQTLAGSWNSSPD